MRNVKAITILILVGSAHSFVGACGRAPEKSHEDDDGSGGATSTTIGSGGTGVGSGGAGVGGGTTVPGGPAVESFTADPAVLQHYIRDSVLLVAQVSDPDGSADIVGGVVKDDAGNTYGTLMKSGGGGAFALTLDWDEIEALAPIEFTTGIHGTRTLIAEFTDASDNVGTKSLTLELTCYDSLGYCDGYCTDTNTDDLHCGSCNNACLCSPGGICNSCDPATSTSSCASICASKGKTCSVSACGVDGIIYTNGTCSGSSSGTVSCTGTLPQGALAVECCCV